MKAKYYYSCGKCGLRFPVRRRWHGIHKWMFIFPKRLLKCPHCNKIVLAELKYIIK